MPHRKVCRIKSQRLRKRPFFEDFCKRHCKGRSERLQGGGNCDWVKTKKRVRRDCGLCAGRFLNAQLAGVVYGIAGNFRSYANEAFKRLSAASLAFRYASCEGPRDICRLVRDALLYSRVGQIFRFVPCRKSFGETPEISELFDFQFCLPQILQAEQRKSLIAAPVVARFGGRGGGHNFAR